MHVILSCTRQHEHFPPSALLTYASDVTNFFSFCFPRENTRTLQKKVTIQSLINVILIFLKYYKNEATHIFYNNLILFAWYYVKLNFCSWKDLKILHQKNVLQCFRCKAISFVVTLKGHVKKATWKLESQERTELMSQLFMTSSCAWAIFVFVSQLLRQFACVCEWERGEGGRKEVLHNVVKISSKRHVVSVPP